MDDVEPAESGGPEAGDGARARSWTVVPLAAWVFAFVLLRIFAVSGYDWSTAFNVSTTLSLSDGGNLLFGSLMGGHVLVEVLVVLILPLLAAEFLWTRRGRRAAVVMPGAVAVVVLVALTISYGAWWLPVAAPGVLGVFAVIRSLPSASAVRRAMMAVVTRVGLVGAVGVLLAAAFIDSPWVPEETIETTGGTLVGYVLSVDSGFINVLTEDQEFLIINTDDVLGRS